MASAPLSRLKLQMGGRHAVATSTVSATSVSTTRLGVAREVMGGFEWIVAGGSWELKPLAAKRQALASGLGFRV